MEMKPSLTQADAELIIQASAEHALAHGWRVTIAVVDDGGNLMALKRLDGAGPMTARFAPGKAHTAALTGKDSAFYESSINNGRYALLSVPQETMLEGGVPIIYNGKVAGAVGVSGVKSDQDAQVSKAGVDALMKHLAARGG